MREPVPLLRPGLLVPAALPVLFLFPGTALAAALVAAAALNLIIGFLLFAFGQVALLANWRVRTRYLFREAFPERPGGAAKIRTVTPAG